MNFARNGAASTLEEAIEEMEDSNQWAVYNFLSDNSLDNSSSMLNNVVLLDFIIIFISLI